MAEHPRQREAIVVTDEVPGHLRDLIPLAEAWAMRDPHRCDEVIEQSSTEDLRPFVQTIEQHVTAINAWLDTMPKDMAQWPKAAEVFLYLIRNWHEAACELYARDTYGGAAPDAVPDADGK